MTSLIKQCLKFINFRQNSTKEAAKDSDGLSFQKQQHRLTRDYQTLQKSHILQEITELSQQLFRLSSHAYFQVGSSSDIEDSESEGLKQTCFYNLSKDQFVEMAVYECKQHKQDAHTHAPEYMHMNFRYTPCLPLSLMHLYRHEYHTYICYMLRVCRRDVWAGGRVMLLSDLC